MGRCDWCNDAAAVLVYTHPDNGDTELCRACGEELERSRPGGPRLQWLTMQAWAEAEGAADWNTCEHCGAAVHVRATAVLRCGCVGHDACERAEPARCERLAAYAGDNPPDYAPDYPPDKAPDYADERAVKQALSAGWLER